MTNTNPKTKAILDTTKNTTCANIIADLVGHPHSMPTHKELEYLNPSIEPGELSDHLRTLVDVGVIEVVEDEQHTFYCLTARARVVFDKNNLFEEDTYQSVYEEVHKPPEILQLEDLDRPVDARDAALSHTSSTATEYDDGETFDTTTWRDRAEEDPEER